MGTENGVSALLAMRISSAVVLGVLFLGSRVGAHCEIPCGIYDDQARILMLEEDIATIEKSMKNVSSLSSEKPANHNQLIRWVGNKDNHADKVQETVARYFMAQRIKPVADGDSDDRRTYLQQLALLHGILVSATKAKQTIDLDHVQTMRRLLREFVASYLSAEDRKHIEEHHAF